MSSARGAGTALRALGAVSLGVFALSPLLPLLARVVPLTAPLGRVFDFWFDLHCERNAARTPSVWGVPLGVCMRCSGIYFGLGLGALLRRPKLSANQLRIWVGVGAALMLLDVTLEEQGLHGSWPTLRLLTGVLLSYPVGVGLGAALTRAPADNAAQSP